MIEAQENHYKYQEGFINAREEFRNHHTNITHTHPTPPPNLDVLWTLLYQLLYNKVNQHLSIWQMFFLCIFISLQWCYVDGVREPGCTNVGWSYEISRPFLMLCKIRRIKNFIWVAHGQTCSKQWNLGHAQRLCNIRCAQRLCNVRYAQRLCNVRYAQRLCNVGYAQRLCNVRYAQRLCNVGYAQRLCNVKYAQRLYNVRYAERQCNMRYAQMLWNVRYAQGYTMWDYMLKVIQCEIICSRLYNVGYAQMLCNVGMLKGEAST